jgi:hypothetical protein
VATADTSLHRRPAIPINTTRRGGAADAGRVTAAGPAVAAAETAAGPATVETVAALAAIARAMLPAAAAASTADARARVLGTPLTVSGPWRRPDPCQPDAVDVTSNG